MTDVAASITLTEWESRNPASCPALVGCFLSTRVARRAAKALRIGRKLGVLELRQGLQIDAYSHVGRVQIGNLTVTVLPKIRGASLLHLLRYAFGFRRLRLSADTAHLVDNCGLEELLICQLNAEVQELLARGLVRAYVPLIERLSSPRGRIDLTRLALDGGTIAAALPCQHHPRVEDTSLNRVLLAGLKLAGAMTRSLELRRETHRLASMMDERVAAIVLSGAVLDQAARRMNRLSTAYVPALTIIRLLVECQGVVLDTQNGSTVLQGFLFDMNAFFQALVSRFLHDNLVGYVVQDEHVLRGMLRYSASHNPQNSHPPTPRPDYVVMRGAKICSVLDAKYRDIWKNGLPREMLYQLVIYAISQHPRCPSSILYPTVDGRAKEARIDVLHPMHETRLGEVCLRPMDLPKIAALIQGGTKAGREREAYARSLVFGEGE